MTVEGSDELVWMRGRVGATGGEPAETSTGGGRPNGASLAPAAFGASAADGVDVNGGASGVAAGLVSSMISLSLIESGRAAVSP